MGEDRDGPSWTTTAKVTGVVLAVILLLAGLPFVADLLAGQASVPVWAGAIGVLGGAALSFLGTRAYQERQLLRDTPTSAVRSLSVGTAEVQGRAQPLTEPLVSPLTHTPACWFELEVEEKRTVRKNRLFSSTDPHERPEKKEEWQTVLTVTEKVPFCIDDGTGRVPVEAEGAELVVDVEDEAEVDGGHPPPEELGTWAEEHDTFEGPEIHLPGRLGEMVEAVRSGELEPEQIQPRDVYPEVFETGNGEPAQLDPNDVKLASLLYGRQEPGEEVTAGGEDGGSTSLFGTAREVFSTGKEVYEAASQASGRRYLTRTTGNERRFEERVLGAGETAYVFGAAHRLPEADSVENVRNLVLEDDPTTGRFLVSDRSLQRLLDDRLVTSALYFGGAAVLLTYGIVGFLLWAGLP